MPQRFKGELKKIMMQNKTNSYDYGSSNEFESFEEFMEEFEDN